MLRRWEKKLDIFGPIEQAARCLELWLKEGKRHLPAAQKQRAAALMARYLHHEDQVTDELMLSFLRHYSNRGNVVDMEDPTSVRMEIKALLDQSVSCDPAAAHGKRPLLAMFVAGLTLMAVMAGIWEISHKKITREQQASLKEMVRQVVLLDKHATHAAVWAEVKAPLQVRSYQNISWWKYRQGRMILQKKIEGLKKE